MSLKTEKIHVSHSGCGNGREDENLGTRFEILFPLHVRAVKATDIAVRCCSSSRRRFFREFVLRNRRRRRSTLEPLRRNLHQPLFFALCMVSQLCDHRIFPNFVPKVFTTRAQRPVLSFSLDCERNLSFVVLLRGENCSSEVTSDSSGGFVVRVKTY